MKRHTFRIVRIGWSVLGALMVALSGCGPATPTPGTPTPPPETPTVPPPPATPEIARDFGITWSSTYYIDPTTPSPQEAVNAGASWDRWDFHWQWIMSSGTPVWEGQSPGEPLFLLTTIPP